MKRGLAFLMSWVLLGSVVASQAFAQNGAGAKTYDAGNALLAKGDLPEALQAYAKAVRSDPSNEQYAQQFMLVRRVIVLKKSLKEETDAQRWEQTALALRSFYVGQKLYTQALPLDEQIHARMSTARSAAQLAETQLSLNKSAEAAKVLSSLPPDKTTPATQSLLGIALARQKKVDEARKIAHTVVLPDDADSYVLYVAARMQAAVGNNTYALALLTRCFEAVAPSRLDGVKLYAKNSPDFAKMASAASFAEALQTESKVQESKCSLGSRCSNCPNRAGCPKSRGQ